MTAPAPTSRPLVAFGLTESQRSTLLQVGLDVTWVDVDLTADIDVDRYVLAVSDAVAALPSPTLVLIGPQVFGWASSGRLRVLRDWSIIADAVFVLAVDRDVPECMTQVSTAQLGVGAATGIFLDHPGGLAWLVSAVSA